MKILESTSAVRRLAAVREFLDQLPRDAEVLLVAPSRGAADDLARSAVQARGATFGLHRFSLTQLAARFAAPVLAARRLTPTPPLGVEAVAARALFEASRHESLGYFQPVAATPRFPRALARTLEELALASVSASTLRNAPEVGPDLADLFERFREQFDAASAVDCAQFFRIAAQSAEEGRVSGCRLVLVDVRWPAQKRCSSRPWSVAHPTRWRPFRRETIPPAKRWAGSDRSSRATNPILRSRPHPPLTSSRHRRRPRASDRGDGAALGSGRGTRNGGDRAACFRRQGAASPSIGSPSPSARRRSGRPPIRAWPGRHPAYFERGTRRPHPAGGPSSRCCPARLTLVSPAVCRSTRRWPSSRPGHGSIAPPNGSRTSRRGIWTRVRISPMPFRRGRRR